ncbi:MAG: EAL domain-containing protein [Bauldia sp.]
MAGIPPDADATEFIARVKTVARVFLYKVYDADGVPRFVSDDRPEEASDQEDLAKHNPEAAEAIAEGVPAIELHEGQPPTRPAFYSEAYVPVLDKSGKVAAVVEAYIDQTKKRAEFERVSFASAVALGLLIAAAFGLPAIAWYRRQREQERARGRIDYLANFDALSGLVNRSRLTEDLKRALRDAGPRGRLAVHSIDIDHFTDINDWLGLETGDIVIKLVAERLRAVAAPDDIVARVSGDEFAIVQRAGRERAVAALFAEKVARALAIPAFLHGHEIPLTAGVGVALSPDDGSDAERLIRSAKLALAKGKSEGRGRVSFFSRDLDSETTARLEIEHAVDAALAAGGFTLHYQPLYGEPGEALTGFEALARLPTADGGFIPPSAFIPVAERMGVIDKLGAWVLLEACSTAAAWPEHLTISVNLSAAQFGKKSVADMVAGALTASGLAPGRLLLEITESLLITDRESVTAELARLKALGTRIVMDDFGTGYSSLSYLWRFPFDKIKIDASFMHAYDEPGAPAEKIMRTITALGHALGMSVCVEGVENERQAAHARNIGCDEVQGYHFGVPLAAVDLPATILADFRRGAEVEAKPDRHLEAAAAARL